MAKSVFGQNFDFWGKFRILKKISIFEQNFDFWTKFRFLNKISIFEKILILKKFSIFEQNIDFWPKFWFLNKIFFQFLNKISIITTVPTTKSLKRFWKTGIIMTQLRNRQIVFLPPNYLKQFSCRKTSFSSLIFFSGDFYITTILLTIVLPPKTIHKYIFANNLCKNKFFLIFVLKDYLLHLEKQLIQAECENRRLTESLGRHWL